MNNKIEIKNPYRGVKGYNCFGCSPENTNGLKMKFEVDGENIVCEWKPKDYLQGYHDVLHGGIQATLMDEIASWFVQTKIGTAGVTSELKVKYLKPVYTNNGNIFLESGLKNKRKNLVDIWVKLMDVNKTVCAEAVVTYFTFPEKIAIEKLHYPGKKAFFPFKNE